MAHPADCYGSARVGFFVWRYGLGSAMQEFERGEEQQVETAEAHVAEPAQNTGARGVNLSVLLEAKRRTAEEYGLPDGIRASGSLLELAERPLGIAGRDWLDLILPTGSLNMAADMRQSFEQIALDLAPMRVDMQSVYEGVMEVHRRQWQSVQETLEAARQAMAEQHSQILASLAINFQAAMMPWPTLYPEAPRRQIYVPEPEPTAEEQTLEVVHLQGERWADVLTAALVEGKATKAEVHRLLMSLPEQPAPGMKPPLWEEIEAVALLFKEHGHKYDRQADFVQYLARQGFAMEVSTFQRWMRQYEAVTGENIRPGRGRRKHKPPKRRTM